MAKSPRHILVVGLGNYTHPGTRHNVGMMIVDSLAERFNAVWTKKGQWQAEVATATTTFRMKLPKPNPQQLLRAATATRTTTTRGVSSPSPSPSSSPVTTTTATTATTATSTAATATESDSATVPTTPFQRPPPRYQDVELTLTLLKPLQMMNVSGSSVSRAARDLGLKITDIVVIHDDMERELGKLSFKTEGSANGHNGVKSCAKHLGTQHFRRLRVGIGRPPVISRSSDVVSNHVLGKFKPLEVEKLKDLVYPLVGDEIIRISTAVHQAESHRSKNNKN
ncbi:peptidyl-tRNA hydrolase protein 1 [Podila humilis]|nr:peptidyl-tRNA hydrolase protein 1 [Podila humilis]